MTTVDQRTRHLLDSVFRRMMEADAKHGIEAMGSDQQPSTQAELAHAIGLRTLSTSAASYGLDAATLLSAIDAHAALQTSAMLAALGLRLDAQGSQLVGGSCTGGMLTGIRLGLMLAELVAQEPTG